jgi:tight adherence protein B
VRHIIFFVLTFSIVMWFLSPRFFLFMDQRMASQYVADLIAPPQQKPLHTSVETPREIGYARKHRPRWVSHTLPEYAQCLDSLARATRSHQHPRDALIATLPHLPASPAHVRVVDDLRNGQEIDESLSLQECNDHEQRFFEFLRVSLVHDVFIPQALEQAADLVREDVRHHQDIATATAQARSSATLLTLLPFVVLLLLLLASSTARQGTLTSPFVLTMGVGIILNRVGAWWIQQMVRRSNMTTPDILSSLAQRLCVTLRAGVTLRDAVEAWAAESEPSLHQALVRGEPLANALQEFAHRHSGGSHHLLQVLLEADRDGLPVIHTISRLSLEMRTHRRQQADIRVRQLPTKLMLPLVLCVLPSFIFLTVIPLILANLSQFTFSPPPIPNIS